MNHIKALSISAVFLAAFSCGCDKDVIELAPRQILFDNEGTTECDFRIPAILLNADGELVSFADRRYSERGADIGNGRIEIQSRISRDGGLSWDGDAKSPRTIIFSNDGSGFGSAHGDAAVVCDRSTGEILLLCASGDTGYTSGGCDVGRYYSTDGGRTFSGGQMDSTNGLPQELDKVNKFFSSGRIAQSSIIKVGTHYRIYSALATPSGSLVMYSDDFGKNWSCLGQAQAGGDEAKVEELPDGSVLLSCRVAGKPGRMYNVFRYSNGLFNDGQWQTPVISEGVTSASCNGEILLVRKSKSVWVLLQSVASSYKRENVSIYYKMILASDPYTDPKWYNTWDGCYQVSSTSSCYSSMTQDANGNIAFIWEENAIMRDWVESYDIMFETISLYDILMPF